MGRSTHVSGNVKFQLVREGHQPTRLSDRCFRHNSCCNSRMVTIDDNVSDGDQPASQFEDGSFRQRTSGAKRIEGS
jgi:hypothetical protein